MIAVLHEVSANMDEEGNIQRDAFKVVYVAPMKALAAEVTAAFAKRLQPLGRCGYVGGVWYVCGGGGYVCLGGICVWGGMYVCIGVCGAYG